MRNVLIIDEDRDSVLELQEFLQSQNTKVYHAATMDEALELFIKVELNLIVLDACMSEEDDHRLLRAMRKAKRTPILVLSSNPAHTDRLGFLQAGAHAYMGQPYTLEECLAQAQSLMHLYFEQHHNRGNYYTLAFGKDLIIDPVSRQAFLKGKELYFTRKEFDVLWCLASHPGQVFSREQLYERIWEEQEAFDVDNIIKNHIKAVRQKLSDADIEYIKNVWGVGYRFEKGVHEK